MFIPDVVNGLLSLFGVRIVRSESLARLINAQDAKPSADAQSSSLAAATAAILQEIYHTRLDVSAALITALKDIRVTAQIAAGQSSAAWIASCADKVDAYATRHDMLEQLCRLDIPDGDLAEFGVFTGAVTRFLRPRFEDRAYHAFDSFAGVPESMGLAIRAGDFSLGGAVPALPTGVTIHAGWFEDTVPAFCRSYRGRMAFVYIDCDLFESVRTVLNNLCNHLAPGAIIAFDDWYNFPNWQAHSRRALDELIDRTGATFAPIAITLREHAVAFRYEAAPGG